MSSEWIKPEILDLLFSQEKDDETGGNSGVCVCMCNVAYFQEACVCVLSYILYHHFPRAPKLLSCIRDNYSTIDRHGGAITAFPVTASGFELHHTGDPLNLNPSKL